MPSTTEAVNRRLSNAARWFGLTSLPTSSPPTPSEHILEAALPRPGHLTLLLGGSGSGKSTLLRALATRAKHLPRPYKIRWIRPLPSIDGRPLLSLFPEEPLTVTLSHLARVGLAEASLLPRPIRHLSDGERFRLSLALTLSHAARHPEQRVPTLLLCDEFTSPLDDATALAAANATRRTLDLCPHLAIALATYREHLSPTLKPTTTIYCDYGQWVEEGRGCEV